MKSKFVVTTIAGLVALLAGAPASVRALIFVIFIMIAVDTVTGVLAAASCKELRSSHMRQKMVIKSIQYTILFTLSYAATVITEAWIFAEAGLWTIVTIEATSMLENLSRLQKYGGVSMGPASKLIRLVSTYFDVMQEKNTVVANTTVFPSDPANQPVISTTVVTTPTHPSPSAPAAAGTTK